MPPDVKKLIAGFLVLASVASASALILSGSINRPASSRPAPAPATKQSSLPDNVFIETLPTNTTTGKNSPRFPVEPEDPSNLTDVLAANIARGVVAVNPEGPLGADGNPSLTAPDMDFVLREAMKRGLGQRFVMPDWNAEAARQSIVVESSARAEDLERYNRDLAAIFNSYLGQRGIAGVTPEAVAVAPGDFDFSQLPVGKALEATRKVSVPARLVGVHRDLLALLVYQKNALALREEAYRDPLKAALILDAYKSDYYALLNRLARGLQTAASETSDPPPEGLSMVAQLFGVRVVHAQWVVTDPGLTAAYLAGQGVEIARTIWEWVQKLLLDVLRDQIIHRMVNQVILWIQGGGTPQFITNWKSFLGGAANVAAGKIIEDVAPGLCRSFGPLIRLQLEDQYLGGDLPDAPPVTCTLDQVVENVENFYRDFTQGGWAGYGEMILPSGNYFGQLFEGSHIVALNVAGAKARAEVEAKAASGFKGPRVCVQGGPSEFDRCQEENVFYCMDSVGDRSFCAAQAYKICKNKSKEPDLSKEGCDEWQITTPGAAVGQKVYEALGAPIKRIVNAQDIRALFSALINAAFYKLVKIIDGKPDQSGILGLRVAPASSSCDKLSGAKLENCLRGSLCERFDDPKQKQQCVDQNGEGKGQCSVAFGATSCPGQGAPTQPNCGSSVGSLAYLLRTRGLDMYVAPDGARYLWNVGAAGNPAIPSTYEEWIEAPPAEDLESWCSQSGSDAWRAEHSVSSPVASPQPSPNIRCIDGSQGVTPPGAVTCTSSSTPPEEDGGPNCGAGAPLEFCKCGEGMGVQKSDYRFYEDVRAAQGAVRDRARAGEEVGYDASTELVKPPNNLYINTVGEEIKKLNGDYQFQESVVPMDDILALRLASNPGYIEYYDIVKVGQAPITIRKIICEPNGNPNWP